MRKLLTILCFTASSLLNCVAEPKFDQRNGYDQLPVGNIYLSLIKDAKSLNQKEIDRLRKGWVVADVPMILESSRFIRDDAVARFLHTLLKEKSGKKFDLGDDEWQQWLWSQEYQEHSDYADFKAKLYKAIDPKFEAYFDKKPKKTIRLDEVRWGGVLQDGIPPLRNPEMIPAGRASYLADSDVVFGIEVAGDFRAYPKRILAWHEMFTDTIQGVPLAGVY